MRKNSASKRRRRLRLVITAALLAALLLTAVHVGRGLFPDGYRDLVESAAARHGVPRELVWAVIWAESRFREQAVSPAGAVGLMQLTGDTYDWLLTRTGEPAGDLFDPEINIEYGTYNLSLLLLRYDSLWMSLAAYNAGRARVDGWLAGGVEQDTIPYEETRRYCARVRAVKIIYEILY